MYRVEFQRKLSRLIGCKVSHRRLAGDMLILYFGGEPGDPDVISITLATAWRYAKGKKIILGVGDIPCERNEGETKECFKERFNDICNLCTPLVYSELQKLDFDEVSNDLCMEFSQEQILESFACYTNDYCWSYHNHKEKIRVYVSVNAIKEEKIE
ncbi:MAG: hypothetical protein GY777_10680 [Candidatus Brocadiaceae bacterium]|nr:hypothetical protein [Candidatus Brocadiaceae bacterium]